MRDIAKASPEKPTSTIFGWRHRLGVLAAILAVLAFAFSAFASANPLGEVALFKTGLRSNAFILNITTGPEGNAWFVDSTQGGGATGIGKVDSEGKITEYISGTNLKGLNAGSSLSGITTGPDKKLWLTDIGATAAIVSIDPSSPEKTVEEKEFSLKAGSKPQGIVTGPDGNLWFANAGTTPAIGAINPSTHEIKECSAGLNEGSKPQGIVTGPDGNLWFTDTGKTKAIGKINPGTCEITEFATGANSEPGGGSANFGPWGIGAGADGNVWFTEGGSNTSNAPTGKAIGHITPAGEITYSYEGLISTSKPLGLTSATDPSGKLWFTDTSKVNEKQELVIEDSGTLGGTYKLGFKGQETGWAGSGNLLSSAKGKGDVKRFTTSCKRTAGSTVLKGCTTTVGAEVGMRITGTGIPATEPFAVIEKIESPNIVISRAPTSGAETATTVTAGRIINIETTEGKFELGQTIKGTGVATSTIVAVGEEGGKGTITPQTPPTAAGTGIALTSETTTVLTNVSTTSGTPTEGLTISGKGIPAGTTIEAINTNLKTLKLTATPTEAGTAVSLSANLAFNASKETIQAAIGKLSTVPNSEDIQVTGSGETSPIKRTFTFDGDFAGTNVPLMTCNGTGLTGTSPTCNISTTEESVPSSIGSIATSGAKKGKITRYPVESVYDLNGITYSSGNAWFTSGFLFLQQIGRFGIEPEVLTVKATGTGTGTVTSSPEGINCGSECEAGYALNTEVTLSAEAAKGSKFEGWSGSGCSGTGTCKVTMSSAKEVTAKFTSTGPTNLRTLTVTKSANGPGGTGSVSSKPKGIKCGTTCSKAVASMYKNTPVILTEKPGTTSTFVEWTGACSGSSPTCTVSMSSNESVGAVFTGTSKTVTPTEALTVSKGESSGKGTVKGPGLGCEAECTSTVVLFQGPITEPKAKAGKVVVLKQAPAFGSVFSGWSGCESEPEGNCQVTMETAKEVVAKYTALPNKVLTVNKEYAKGNGAVSSKPKGIKCGTTCTQAVASMPEGAAVELTAKPSTGTFVKWEGGDCNGSTNPVCVVTMNTDETTKAVFSEPGKAITPSQTLTLNKAGKGFGTVKAAGLGCELLCSSTSVLYQGPITEPKAKPGKVVVLKAVSAPGSKAVSWSGCDSIDGEGNCVVAMETNKTVTAKFDELE